ncbi:MAG: ATP-dependent DNA helicase RecG, partial [Candidatus Thiodiazotropha sp. 6PLUC7]
VRYQMVHARIAHLTGQRVEEWQEVEAYLEDAGCKMTFLRRALDDHDPTPCGKCASCIGQPVVDQAIDPTLAHSAGTFLKHAEMVIQPRKQVAPSNAETARAFPIYQFPRQLGA